MIDTITLKAQIKNVLTSSNFNFFDRKITGKVRDIYELKDKIIFITTDRQSAFDRQLALVPFKGQVLTESSVFWFEKTASIVKNHLLDHPDPNVIVGKKLTIFPVEFVVRGYLTGVTSTSAWTAYEKGDRQFCGNELPNGMVKNQAFSEPIITPTTKSEDHDEKITPQEILEQNLMTAEQWDYCKNKSLELFRFGNQLLQDNNLILVDTKYEFGYDEKGDIYLCDEIHTPDSSRYWLRDSYQDNFKLGKEPQNIDKEFLRLWFKDHCDPYNDTTLPQAPEDLIVELSSRYIQAYEMITGKSFINHEKPIENRIQTNLIAAGYSK